MGMGEPLHNYDAVARALRLLTHADGSTFHPARDGEHLGLVPEIERLGREFNGEVALAVSLHARRRAPPAAHARQPQHLLAGSGRAYPRAPPPHHHRAPLLAGVNDRPEHARALVKLSAASR